MGLCMRAHMPLRSVTLPLRKCLSLCSVPVQGRPQKVVARSSFRFLPRQHWSSVSHVGMCSPSAACDCRTVFLPNFVFTDVFVLLFLLLSYVCSLPITWQASAGVIASHKASNTQVQNGETVTQIGERHASRMSRVFQRFGSTNSKDCRHLWPRMPWIIRDVRCGRVFSMLVFWNCLIHSFEHRPPLWLSGPSSWVLCYGAVISTKWPGPKHRSQTSPVCKRWGASVHRSGRAHTNAFGGCILSSSFHTTSSHIMLVQEVVHEGWLLEASQGAPCDAICAAMMGLMLKIESQKIHCPLSHAKDVGRGNDTHALSLCLSVQETYMVVSSLESDYRRLIMGTMDLQWIVWGDLQERPAASPQVHRSFQSKEFFCHCCRTSPWAQTKYGGFLNACVAQPWCLASTSLTFFFFRRFAEQYDMRADETNYMTFSRALIKLWEWGSWDDVPIPKCRRDTLQDVVICLHCSDRERQMQNWKGRS